MDANPILRVPFPRQDEALAMLNRVAKQVSPIMKKRGWKVRSLIEIFPKDPSLQGYNKNRGELIALRLRSHHNHSAFLSWEHILGTMLHELSHNLKVEVNVSVEPKIQGLDKVTRTVRYGDYI